MNQEQLIEKYGNLLNEEKWTRATINNYTIKNFEELNDLIVEFKDNHITEEIKTLTDDHLNKNRNSISALYMSAIFQAEEGAIEDGNVYSLVKLFADNLKWNIVEYVCEKIYEKVKDKFIIRSLLEAYTNLGKKEKIPEIWEELIKVDFEEALIVVKLAEEKEAKGLTDEAISYYKKAINRYIHNKNFTQVEDLWKKLLSFNTISYDFFVSLDKKITKNFNDERSIELLTILYEFYKKEENYDICLKILKIILEKDSSNEYARKEIVFVYTKKYAGHSQLNEYIKKSNLDGLWRTSNEAISSFEKHIAFDKGNFVQHREWGIGVIKSIEKDQFIIDFQKMKNHKMSLKLALTSLTVLPKNHISILKLKNKDKLKQMLKSDVVWGLKILIKSFNNRAKMKDFKAELVTDVFTQSEWNSWWNEGKKVLKENPLFGTLDEDSDIFELRDKPLSHDEKISNSFKASKDFYQRFNIALEAVNGPEIDSDVIEDIAAYFGSFVTSTNNVNEQTFISYLLLDKMQKTFSYLNVDLKYQFSRFIDEIDDPYDIYDKISSYDMKKDFLTNLKKSDKNWPETFLRFFYQSPNKFIYDELNNYKKEYIEKMYRDLISAYKEYREAFFWIVNNTENRKFFEEIGINYDNIIFSLLHLIELCGKDISIKKDTTQNKKISNQVKDFLFKTGFIIDYLEKSNKEFAKRLYTISSELISLEADHQIKIKEKISEKYPDIDVENQGLAYEEGIKKNTIIDKLLTTSSSYTRVQKELQNIQDVEIPDNSKEIGLAMEKGDLRENAEFKAAKERQEILRNKLTKLHNDLTKATIVNKKDITDSFITFGTHVELDDKINNTKIKYTILGPWESNTENNIISYQSPLGAKMLDKKVNEEVIFSLNDKNYHYVVKKIVVADF